MAISSPIIPPPTTSIRFGMPSNRRASVESITLSSSKGNIGNFVTLEPTDIMHCSNSITSLLPSRLTLFLDKNLAYPFIIFTFLAFASAWIPPVSLLTMPSLFFFTPSRSILGFEKVIPSSLACLLSLITSAV